jgi:hypothetical protein
MSFAPKLAPHSRRPPDGSNCRGSRNQSRFFEIPGVLHISMHKRRTIYFSPKVLLRLKIGYGRWKSGVEPERENSRNCSVPPLSREINLLGLCATAETCKPSGTVMRPTRRLSSGHL